MAWTYGDTLCVLPNIPICDWVYGEITQGVATKRGFDWGESSDALINEWYEEGTFYPEEFSHALTGLIPGQGFCHRAKACE